MHVWMIFFSFILAFTWEERKNLYHIREDFGNNLAPPTKTMIGIGSPNKVNGGGIQCSGD